MTAFDLTPPSDAQRTALVAGLSEDERRVLLQHGTEAPFCGVFLDNKQDGVYTCRLCGLPLFRSSAKFDSGTGWCKGCGRSRADCRDWKRRPETRPGILRRLKDRMRALREAGRR